MILEAIILTISIYKGSQAVNHISGGEDTLTLTEQSYRKCQGGGSCIEQHLYTGVFFPADVIATTVTGRPDLIGSSHGEIWHEIEKKLPQISQLQESYGGRNYIGFLQKRR
jgi:hypothetical protein